MDLNLIINGEPKRFSGPLNVEALVAALGLTQGKVAVEQNLEIVPRSMWAGAPVADGDRFEIVRFIGGG